MLFAALGKRYERLLFFTAPISLAALVVFVVALASTRQQERIDAKCYATVATALSADKENLDKAWKNALPFSKRNEYWGLSYKLQLQLAWIRADAPTVSCYKTVDEMLDTLYRQPPGAIIGHFKKTVASLLEKPLEMYGVELPRNTTIDLLGTKIQIELITLARMLQMVLLPVLLMWLGSLYSTRHRETLLISRSSSMAEVFPHLINFYVVGHIPTPRKRNVLAPYAVRLVSVIASWIRVGLLSIFVLPPVSAYIASLYLMGNERFALFFIGAGGVVALCCVMTLGIEFHPQHASKSFRDPSRYGDI